MVLGDSPLDLARDVEPLAPTRRMPETGGEWAIRSRRLGTVARSGGTSMWPVRSVCAESQSSGSRDTGRLRLCHRRRRSSAPARRTVHHGTPSRAASRSVRSWMVRGRCPGTSRCSTSGYVPRWTRRSRLNSSTCRTRSSRQPGSTSGGSTRCSARLSVSASVGPSRPRSSIGARSSARSCETLLSRDGSETCERHRESALAMRAVAYAAPHLVAAWIE